MKKLLLSMIYLCSFFTYSQGNSGYYGGEVGISSGYVQNGFGIGLNYDYGLNQFDYIQAELLFTFSSEKVTDLRIEVPYNSFIINGGYFRQVARILRDVIVLKVGGGASVGYEIINNGDKELSSGALIVSDSKFIAGLFIGLETKIYINEYWQAAVKYKQFYQPNSDIGNFTPYIAIGINYYLF